MKFSIAAISALVLSSAVTFTAADSYSDAMKSWCGGKHLEYQIALYIMFNISA